MTKKENFPMRRVVEKHLNNFTSKLQLTVHILCMAIRPLTKRLYYRMQKVLLECIRKGNILKLQRIRFICVDVGIPNINHSATDRISTLTGTREKQLLIVLCCKMLRK